MDSKHDLSSARELLTQKELQCLFLVAQDNTSYEISQKLHRSLDTIKKYRSSLLQKLGCHTMGGAVMLGIKMRLFDMTMTLSDGN